MSGLYSDGKSLSDIKRSLDGDMDGAAYNILEDIAVLKEDVNALKSTITSLELVISKERSAVDYAVNYNDPDDCHLFLTLWLNDCLDDLYMHFPLFNEQPIEC